MNDDHEPLNGLDSRISTRGYFERVLTERDKADRERDKRLDERFEAQEKAVNAALAAAEKAVTAALAAAEKAVEKSEMSQQRVNEGQNEFRATLKDQAAELMPRAETELLVKDLRTQIDQMRGTSQQGRAEGKKEDRASTSNLTTIVSAVAAVIAISIALYAATRSASSTPTAPPATVTVTVPLPPR